MELNKIYNMDCLKYMPNIPSKSIDLIICDLPYGTTKNKWDIIISLEDLWKEYNRIIKDNGAICLFADGMFMAKLMLSNEKMWRYNLIWDKVLTSGFLNANRQPLRRHEEICVFYKKQPKYNPQFTQGKPLHGMGNSFETKLNENNNYNTFNSSKNPSANRKGDTKKYPKSILKFSRKPSSKMLHPTEKSVELYEWIIKTYTNENDVVLDNCLGSGTLIEACQNTNRNFLGCEKEEKYFKQCLNRTKIK